MPLSKDNMNVYTPLSDKKMTLEELKEISMGRILIAGKIPQDFCKKLDSSDNKTEQLTYSPKSYKEEKKIKNQPKSLYN